MAEIDNEYKFSQTGEVIEDVIARMLAFFRGDTLEGGEVCAHTEDDEHYLTEKANATDVRKIENTVKGLVQQMRDVVTTNVLEAVCDILVKRMQGRDAENYDKTLDPIKYWVSTDDDPTAAFNAYADSLHGDGTNNVPHGIIRCNIWGAFITLLNTPMSYAEDMWAQVAINATIDSHGKLVVGEGICVRTLAKGSGAWHKLGEGGGSGASSIDVSSLLEENGYMQTTMEALCQANLYGYDINGIFPVRIASGPRGYKLIYEKFLGGIGGGTLQMNTFELTNVGSGIQSGPLHIYSINMDQEE